MAMGNQNESEATAQMAITALTSPLLDQNLLSECEDFAARFTS